MVHRPCFSSKIAKLLMSILLTLTGVSAGAEPNVTVEGQAQYSFRPDHFALQTSRGTLHIRGDFLSTSARRQLERATASAGEVRIEIPARSVEYYSDSIELAVVETASREIEGFWILNPKQARIEGTKRMSWEESFYLIQAGLKVLKVSVSRLSPSQAQRIQSVGPGGHISVEVPIRSVELAWALPLQEPELPALAVMDDRVTVEMDHVEITGTVLWLWSEAKSEVLSRNHVIRFNRSAADAVMAGDLDQPGSRVSVKVPLAAVDAIWSIDPKESMATREPAGLVP